ncbi:putative ubiquitin-protein ligase UBR2 NDAI_0I02310 [Naumovozyma dairenensis CBS 421]|uniref:E3 ubiquitin-protein ligase n=1 Tax=Naumovozyma dairenensis (strain ATCC 10597 / BCRC 20456 / CBS 421 / NBRC 0211 / NRRL Y-12639) TaxID=1071378 RepID=G0WG89_NAUDC|nr:hypothetical protein NDAI_0I02310 [Naumovozyma dairenensis CBS 421]CCD26800.1 hypothetical protein NDAI_0I02310 [Naumovozyma dairenensis CBS 421]
MSRPTIIIQNLKTFLTHLPTFAENEYNELCSYIVWKTLNSCIKIDNDHIDWDSLTEPFLSENWKNGNYQKILNRYDDNAISWKDLYFQENNDNQHKNTMCNRQSFAPETVFYCFTCVNHPLYEICESCFDPSKHIGHSYTSRIIDRPEGGICHCGDPCAFKNLNDCRSCKNNENNHTGPEISTHDQNILETLDTVLDYIVDSIYYLKENNGIYCHIDEDDVPITGYFDDTSSLNFDDNENDLHLMLLNQYENNTNLDTVWAIQIDWTDNDWNPLDLTRKVSEILNTPIEYMIVITELLESRASSATILRSKDIHKLKRVMKEFEKENIKVRLRRTRDIFIQDLIEDLLDWIYRNCLDRVSSITFKYTLRTSMLNKWNSRMETDITYDPSKLHSKNQINLFGGFLVTEEQRSTWPWFKPWHFPAIEDDYISQILVQYNGRLLESDSKIPTTGFYSFSGSRFQHLFMECTAKFNKLSFAKLFRVLCTLFTIKDNSNIFLAAQYLDVYLSGLYNMVASDPSGDKLALMGALSQYTFQDPEVANIAIKHGFIERTLRFSFTLLAFSPDDLMPYLPVALYPRFKLPMGSIRNKKLTFCIKDLSFIMSLNTVPEFLLQNSSISNTLLEALLEFDNINIVKRETTEHVRYEKFEFSGYFFFLGTMLVLMESYLRNITQLRDLDTRRTIVLRFIDTIMRKEFESLGKFRGKYVDSENAISQTLHRNWNDENQLLLKHEEICDHISQTINFQVGVDPQSFFNPMSYLFRFVIQWSQCGRVEPLDKIFEKYIDFQDVFKDKERILHMSESALSTIVLIAQINAGFWVRNGSPITYQANMYTRYSLRETAYMSDLFNIQLSMSFADPDDFLVTYLSRWGLKHWSNGIPNCDYPDKDTTMVMVNEALLLLIRLLTEIRFLTMVSSLDGFLKILRREIINALNFESCSYSTLTMIIPEHITKHPSFDLELEELAIYVPQTGISDEGLYHLKSKYVELIDPYYIGQSSTRRYEISKNIRLNMAKNLKIPLDETFIPVTNVIKSLKSTIYSNLFSISSRDTFGRFLKTSLEHIKKFKNENLLTDIVHLVHICVINNLDEFAKIFWHEYGVISIEFCYHHSIGSILYSCLLMEEFSNVHGEIKEIFRYLLENVPHMHVNSFLNEQVPSFNPEILWHSKQQLQHDESLEKKKNKAKQRKLKLMKRLAKQQEQFISNNKLEKTEVNKTAMDSKEKHEGWDFPDDGCVFCKMELPSETYIYFSYVERNICNFELSLITDVEESEFCETKPNNVDMQPVLKTCGHGAHISCLGKYMKSLHSMQALTTKNIPISYGFGLVFCPVCNSLVNSILPRISDKYHKNSIEAENEHSSSDELLHTHVIKCSRILLEVVEDDRNKTSLSRFDELIVNNVSNLEMQLRSKYNNKNSNIFSLPYQIQLTLHLLVEMRTYLKRCIPFCVPKSINISANDIDWGHFLQHSVDVNVLNWGLGMLMAPKAVGANPSVYLPLLLKLKLYQDSILLARELIRMDLSLQDTTSSEFDSCMFDVDVLRTVTSILQDQISFFSPNESKEKIFEKLWKCRLFVAKFLSNSFCVFLKRFYVLFKTKHPLRSAWLDTDTTVSGTKVLNQLMAFFSLPSFEALVREFNEVDQNEIHSVLDRCNFQITIGKLHHMKLHATDELKLIALPTNLSYFFNTDKTQLQFRAFHEDIALCLLCGSKLRSQKPVPLRKYLLGECTNHARNDCNISTTYGVFLMVRHNAIYLSYGERGTFFLSPYLNKYGASDVDFKYNMPVYLNTHRYSYLCNEVLLGNMIPHLVYRKTEGVSDLGGWETI